MGLFLLACKGCIKALCWRGVDGQCYIMLAGLCDFAQETRPKVGAGAIRFPWFVACGEGTNRINWGLSPILSLSMSPEAKWKGKKRRSQNQPP